MTAPNPLYQEGYSMTYTTDQQAVTVAQIEAARRYIRGEDDAIAWAIQAAIAASPEPVPATNQAGEVERDNSTDLAHIRGDLKPLATQPATSQEGEEPTCERCDRGVCVDPHYEDDDRLNRPAATPTPPTLSEDLREALHDQVRDVVERFRTSGIIGCSVMLTAADAEWLDAALTQVKAS